MNTAKIRSEIVGEWTERGDGWWLTVPAAQIQKIARTMLKAEARFVTIVALSEPDNVMQLSWHWDMDGMLLSVVSLVAEGASIPSIVDIYPGADWAERETRDYYAVTFEGRKDTPTLMLRAGDKPGSFLRTSGDRL